MVAVRFGSAAEADLAEALAWYGVRSTASARRFLVAVNDAVRRIAANPLAYPVAFRDLRRTRAVPFPYVLYYSIEADGLVVIALSHERRNPTHWRRRG